MKQLLSVIFLFCCFGHVLRADDTRDVLIVVGPSTHPPGSHEVVAGGRVMKHCLEHSTNLPKVKVELVEGWPSKDQRDAAETVVFIGDTFPANRLPNAQQNLADLDVMMACGCGIVCIHYATGLRGEDVSTTGDHPLLRWLGGYFANRTCPHHESFAKIFPKATITPAAPQHPISRGWREFTLHDEPYYNNYFGPGNSIASNVTLLATSMLPPESPKQETVAWCIERIDGGRGFGIVMPHFYKNWQEEDLRRFILNGIVWSAKFEVPADGVQTTLPDLAEFSPTAVEFRADPAPLVRRIVAAAGGKAKLLSRFTIHEKLNVSDDLEAPAKPRESVFDGHHDWWYRSGNGGWKKKENEPAADLVWAWTLQALLDQSSKLEVLEEIIDDGQALVGLRISDSIKPAMDLYVDKQTHLLARIDWRSDINRFSDWKEHDGAKYPARCVGTRKSTGKTWFVSEITELRRLKKLPPELTSQSSSLGPWQYRYGDIRIPAASVDEPKRASFDQKGIRQAVEYLDAGGLAWTHEQTCMACHTTGVYMAERTQLTTWFGPPREEIRAAFVADVPSAESLKGALPNRPHGFPVWRSLGLAQWDRHVSGKLSHATDVSLREMLLRLPEEGLYKTVDKVEIPYTTTGFELSVQAARALAAAPGWVDGLSDPDLQARLTRLKKALAAHQPRNDYERVLQLQLATAMPELVPQEVRDANLSMLRQKQHSDGGWSTRDMSAIENWGDKIRPDNIAMLQSEPDAEQPASDAYMTAFSVILMRENGVQVDDPAIRKAIDWLTSEQRVSGRWWMKSLYKQTKHFSSYIATVHALRALALCDAIPDKHQLH